MMSDEQTGPSDHYFHVTAPPCDECDAGTKRLAIICAVVGAAAGAAVAFMVLKNG
jgi:hypothetical protein